MERSVGVVQLELARLASPRSWVVGVAVRRRRSSAIGAPCELGLALTAHAEFSSAQHGSTHLKEAAHLRVRSLAGSRTSSVGVCSLLSSASLRRLRQRAGRPLGSASKRGLCAQSAGPICPSPLPLPSPAAALLHQSDGSNLVVAMLRGLELATRLGPRHAAGAIGSTIVG